MELESVARAFCRDNPGRTRHSDATFVVERLDGVVNFAQDSGFQISTGVAKHRSGRPELSEKLDATWPVLKSQRLAS